jgi:hypothetical protein
VTAALELGEDAGVNGIGLVGADGDLHGLCLRSSCRQMFG